MKQAKHVMVFWFKNVFRIFIFRMTMISDVPALTLLYLTLLTLFLFNYILHTAPSANLLTLVCTGRKSRSLVNTYSIIITNLLLRL